LQLEELGAGGVLMEVDLAWRRTRRGGAPGVAARLADGEPPPHLATTVAPPPQSPGHHRRVGI
jgi:hypothetical protein